MTRAEELALERDHSGDGATRLLGHGRQASTRGSTSFQRIDTTVSTPLALHDHRWAATLGDGLRLVSEERSWSKRNHAVPNVVAASIAVSSISCRELLASAIGAVAGSVGVGRIVG